MRAIVERRGTSSRRTTRSVRCLAAGSGAMATMVALAASVAVGQDGKRAAAPERMLVKEATVRGTVDDVWAAWTTPAGIASFFSPDCRIELTPGGPYELYMGMSEPDASGLRGSEGCRVLSFIPRAMLAFEWNFPPAVPTLRNARAKTFVVLRFDAAGEERVCVRFAQLGWQEGEDWDAGYAYFDKAWGKVLASLVKAREAGRTPPAAPAAPGESKTWMDGEVRVSAVSGAGKRQEFELELAAPVARVWQLLATTEGLRELGGDEPCVELRPGGRYAFWPDSNNRVMAFVPHEMLSVSGSAPPRFPNVRNGGTWGVYSFEALRGGRTRLRLVSVGWKEGDKEWDEAFDYFLKNNAAFLKHLAVVAAGKTGE